MKVFLIIAQSVNHLTAMQLENILKGSVDIQWNVIQ